MCIRDRQYDTVIADAGEGSTPMGQQLPSADELAAEVERFLAGHDDEDGGGPEQRDDPPR